MTTLSTLTLLSSSIIILFPQKANSAYCAGQDNPYHCFTYPEVSLDPWDECAYENTVCDGVADCPFGDDEWNCVPEDECIIDNQEWFECSNSTASDWLATSDDRKICIPYVWTCYVGDYIWDCPMQEDVADDFCSIVDPNYQSCEDNPLYFQCTDTNDRCLDSWRECDGIIDCIDGQDEADNLCAITPQPTAATNEPSSDPTPQPTAPSCNEQVEVVFIIDVSTSISSDGDGFNDEFTKLWLEDTMEELFEAFDNDNTKEVSFGLVYFSQTSHKYIKIGEHTFITDNDIGDFVDVLFESATYSIRNMYQFSDTATVLALNDTYDLFIESNTNDKHFAILVTDGFPNIPSFSSSPCSSSRNIDSNYASGVQGERIMLFSILVGNMTSTIRDEFECFEALNTGAITELSDFSMLSTTTNILVDKIVGTCANQPTSTGGGGQIPTSYPTWQPPTNFPSKIPTSNPTTAEPTTAEPTTAEPTTAEPTTAEPTTSLPTRTGGTGQTPAPTPTGGSGGFTPAPTPKPTIWWGNRNAVADPPTLNMNLDITTPAPTRKPTIWWSYRSR